MQRLALPKPINLLLFLTLLIRCAALRRIISNCLLHLRHLSLPITWMLPTFLHATPLHRRFLLLALLTTHRLSALRHPLNLLLTLHLTAILGALIHYCQVRVLGRLRTGFRRSILLGRLKGRWRRILRLKLLYVHTIVSHGDHREAFRRAV